MKRKVIFILIILMFDLSFSFSYGNQRDDNYGKLVGWIIDPVSNKPVNETFLIEFFNCNELGPLKTYFIRINTNEKGYLSIELKPRHYCIIISPELKTSKYSIEPDDCYYPIIIEKGKITEFKKKATIAGLLKIKIIDIKGKLINIHEKFPTHSEVIAFLTSPNNTFSLISSDLSDDDFKDGEILLHTLYPNTYSIKMTFRYTGFKSLEKHNIIIESGKITEVDFVVDISNETAIEGIVLNKNGYPIKNAEVYLTPNFPVEGDFRTYTNQDGYYKLRGLPEGLFTIHVLFNSTTYPGGRVDIKNNDIVHKDISLKSSIND